MSINQVLLEATRSLERGRKVFVDRMFMFPLHPNSLVVLSQYDCIWTWNTKEVIKIK